MKKAGVLLILFFSFIILFFLCYRLYKIYHIPTNGKSCIARGGNWSVRGFCVLPASDAGKKCSDNHNCKGYCIPVLSPEDTEKMYDIGFYVNNDTGICSSIVEKVGCITGLDNGRLSTTCYD